MTGEMRFDFALQEPALAIAPVFLVLKKTARAKLDVTRSFGVSSVRWRGPDALGIPEQSALLALLSIAGQQAFSIDPNSAVGDKAKLLKQLSCEGPQSDVAVVIAHWRKIEIAAGYSSHSGNNITNIKSAVKRLAETTIWECRDGIEYESRLLSWIRGNDNGVIIALNRRATEAIYGRQFIKISLGERNALPDESTKALHAYLSGSMRTGTTRRLTISKLHAHIWSGEATGSTLRSRDNKLRAALLAIDLLPAWRCILIPRGQVDIHRIKRDIIDGKTADNPRAPESSA
ncbi:hypothetical protein CNX70_06795 [Janthinobacterium svalbardensis]|uniref:Uncharacterized protein n=1 Tax=Janthinobacterium svalbardensis TaxID=368607 RepID=A0A290WTK4_9BURK|nr:replication protein C, IncQ-type [Janthinobacterium svalbardensis]ATD59926.1 hypothetical protein CNX70_06795 [Janthinobacterium svalbardensis]